MKKSLIKSEELFRKAFITSPDSININRLSDGLYVSINTGFTNITGYTEEETTGKTSLEINIWADNCDRDKLVKGLETNGNVMNMEARFRMKDGTLIYGLMSASIIDLDGVPHILSITRDITEKKRVENELKESENRFWAKRKLDEEALLKSKEQYDDLVSKIPVGIYILRTFPDESFVLDYMSPVMAEMLGANMKEMLSDARNIYQLIYPDDRDSFIKLNESGIKSFKPFDWSGRVMFKGSIKWLHISSVPDRQKNGDVLWHGTAIDITERKKVEKMLRDSEENMRYIIKHDPNAIAVYDRDLHYIAVSDRYLNDYNVRAEDVIGKHHYEVFPEMPQRWRDVHKRCLSGTIERNEDDYFERTDGSITYNRWECRPWRKVDGEIGGIITYTEVTTQQKLAEKALIESERLLRESQNIARLGSFVWDILTGLWESSGILDEIFGIDEKFIRSLDGWLSIVHPDSRSIMADYVTNTVIGKRQKFDKEYRIVRKSDGEVRWVHGISELEFDKNNNPVKLIGTIIDITERKAAEDEIQKLNTSLEERVNERTAQLEAANSELQAFAYSVSHDLRAPLRAIDGFSKFVLEDYGPKLDTEGHRLLGLIRSNTLKMDRLITDLLSLSRVARSEQNKSKINMTKMARSMFNEAASLSNQSQLKFVINDLPDAYADPISIKQVWINLISNAVKFSSLKDNPEISIGGEIDKGYNVYFIKDNGVGFNPDYAHKLFGVFQRLHRADEFEGTGVGLAIVQRIINRHGGKVWAEGQEGKGATFYFSIPVLTSAIDE